MFQKLFRTKLIEASLTEITARYVNVSRWRSHQTRWLEVHIKIVGDALLDATVHSTHCWISWRDIGWIGEGRRRPFKQAACNEKMENFKLIVNVIRCELQSKDLVSVTSALEREPAVKIIKTSNKVKRNS